MMRSNESSSPGLIINHTLLNLCQEGEKVVTTTLAKIPLLPVIVQKLFQNTENQ